MSGTDMINIETYGKYGSEEEEKGIKKVNEMLDELVTRGFIKGYEWCECGVVFGT